LTTFKEIQSLYTKTVIFKRRKMMLLCLRAMPWQCVQRVAVQLHTFITLALDEGEW